MPVPPRYVRPGGGGLEVHYTGLHAGRPKGVWRYTIQAYMQDVQRGSGGALYIPKCRTSKGGLEVHYTALHAGRLRGVRRYTIQAYMPDVQGGSGGTLTVYRPTCWTSKGGVKDIESINMSIGLLGDIYLSPRLGVCTKYQLRPTQVSIGLYI